MTPATPIGEQAIRDALRSAEAQVNQLSDDLREARQMVSASRDTARQRERASKAEARVAALEATLRWIADAKRAEEADPMLWAVEAHDRARAALGRDESC